MRRFIRFLTIGFLAIAGAAGFGLVTSCNIIGGSSGGTGNLKLLITDGPTEDWTELTVHFLSASLHRHGSDTWEAFWTADSTKPDSGKVNLIDLSGINEILNAGPIKTGTYDRLKLVMNTSTKPDSMTLITADGATIGENDITVVDPSGKGEIKVDLNPDLVIETEGDAVVGIDFDLAHPLSIVNLDGKVVISLKVRHKTLPRDLGRIQFARTLGDITEAIANTDGTATFKIESVVGGALIEFDANSKTIYTDVTGTTAAAGNFEGLSKLAGTGAALVDSNMTSNGRLYARRVWYADNIDKLPQFSPEGLVRRVGDNWISIQGKKTETAPTGDHHHHCDWDAETVFVDSQTAWNFQGATMTDVKGTDGLRYVARGFRVEVTYRTDVTTSKVAELINIQCAHSEGIVTEPTTDSFKLGWYWHSRTMFYSNVTGHEFGWWFYGDDANRSTDLTALADSVAAAQTAHLWVFARAGLTWDFNDRRWEVEALVLAPVKLHDFTKISEGYNTNPAAPETMVVSTYNCWDETTPETMTIKLDSTGELQTIVGSFIWKADTNVMTFTLPVLPGRWEALLTPTVDKVKIWVHPVKEVDLSLKWHAYSVLAYQFIR